MISEEETEARRWRAEAEFVEGEAEAREEAELRQRRLKPPQEDSERARAWTRRGRGTAAEQRSSTRCSVRRCPTRRGAAVGAVPTAELAFHRRRRRRRQRVVVLRGGRADDGPFTPCQMKQSLAGLIGHQTRVRWLPGATASRRCHTTTENTSALQEICGTGAALHGRARPQPSPRSVLQDPGALTGARRGSLVRTAGTLAWLCLVCPDCRLRSANGAVKPSLPAMPNRGRQRNSCVRACRDGGEQSSSLTSFDDAAGPASILRG